MHKSKWTYDERDIRRAAQAFADFRLDLNDVVEVQLPPCRDRDEEDPEERGRADWRESIASWMFWSARHKHRLERPADEWSDDSWQRIGPDGLPGELTWEEFTAAYSGRRQNIASTRPLELMTRSGGSLFLPSAYVELLDRWEQVTEDLVARARICSRCRAQGPRWGAWAHTDSARLRHPVSAVLGSHLPAVHRPPARRAVQVGPHTGHPRRRLPVPLVLGVPGGGLGSLPRPRPCSWPVNRTNFDIFAGQRHDLLASPGVRN